MKIALVITEDGKQVMMTPENNHEKEALKFIQPEDELKAVSKWGTFDDKPRHMNEQVGTARGGYFRRYATEDSLMFVIESHT